MRKTKEQTQQTRQKLLDAALEIFHRNGVTNTSMQAIADEAGLTRGALYWHFKNKEDLFDALFEQNFAPFNQQLNNIPHQTGNPLVNLHRSFCDLFTLLENDEQQQKFCNVMHLKCEYTCKNATITALAQQYHNRYHLQIHNVFAYCCQKGSLPENLNITLASTYLSSCISGLIYTWITTPDTLNLSQTGELMLNVILDSLKNNPLFQQDLLK